MSTFPYVAKFFKTGEEQETARYPAGTEYEDRQTNPDEEFHMGFIRAVHDDGGTVEYDMSEYMCQLDPDAE